MADNNTTSKSYRTFAIILLTIVYGFNFIDRQIVGILAPFIQKDLGLTNTELGLLIGLAFAIFYTLVAIPIAWLADRYSRVNILSIALATWSSFTALTGLATNFIQIGIARMGVGIGEAGGSPPSHSIISDLYPKEERASALGIYSMGIPLGVMAAYFAAAMRVGGCINDKSKNEKEALTSFGFNLGVCFQITDDILDYYSDNTSFGKKIGNDFYEGKVTLPVIMLYQKSSEAERSNLKKIFQADERTEEELRYTLSLMSKYQVIAACKKRAEHFSSVSSDSLGIFPESKERKRLQDLAFYIVNRIN